MEIERKFLVNGDSWRQVAGSGLVCEQGYLSSLVNGATVRVRKIGAEGWLTIKGPSSGISRLEMEYQIPVADAEVLLQTLCGDQIVSKTRYCVEFSGFVWEIDEFSGANRGLVLAEIELEKEDQRFEKPDWVGQEVSEDSCYYNAALAKKPFSSWK